LRKLKIISSKKDIKILSDLLHLKDVKVISHRIHIGIGIILKTELRLKESDCPICGTSSHRLHQNHRHIIKDLPFGEKPVFLEINRRHLNAKNVENHLVKS